MLSNPGLNEDLAATILWGTQQTELSDKRKQDGVFGLWYGKGPGVDRSGDALRHANLAGTAPCGGVVMVVGDDHAAQSSSAAHQCEFSMMDAQIPLLHPSSVQEVLDLAITGWSLSRASGCWCALKLTTEIAETTAAVEFDLSRYDDLLRFEQETRQSFPDTAIRWPGQSAGSGKAFEDKQDGGNRTLSGKACVLPLVLPQNIRKNKTPCHYNGKADRRSQ